MWFNRQPKNRRLGRGHVLDVKLRSSKVRAARARMAATALAVIFATVLGTFLLWRGTDWLLDRLIYENKAFAIQEIDAQTDGVISADQLRQWSGVRLGDNLLALDLSRVCRDLRLVSAIESVSVEPLLPHSLKIRVIEREPLAQIQVFRPRTRGGIDTVVFFLDAHGYVIMPLEPRQRAEPTSPVAEQLPIVSLPTASPVQAGRRLEAPSVLAALQLLTAFDNSPMAGLVDITKVDASAAEVLTVHTAQGGEVTFGLENMETQLLRWRAIFDAAQQRGQSVAWLDLAVNSSIPLRFAEPSPLPPPTPKPPKKKKHV